MTSPKREPEIERAEAPSGAPDRAADSIRVEINDAQSWLGVDRASLASLARDVLRGEGVHRACVSVALVDDPTIRQLNRRYLGHDWPTDVITFRLSEPDEGELAAEVILSAEMAVTTAGDVGADPRAELALYLVHGLLHLCDYDDQSASEAERMRVREAEVLHRAGISNTYAMIDCVRPAHAGEGLR